MPDFGDLVKDSKKIKTTVVVQSGTLDKDIFKTNTKGVKKEKLVIKQLIFSFIIPVFGILYVIINFLNGNIVLWYSSNNISFFNF